MAPRISVVIPAYNAAPYLAAAIESVRGQGVPDLEIIVVDDGSKDATASIAQSYAPVVRCLRQANSGVARARNRGIAEARGRYLALLDADDEWLPNKIERQMRALTERKPRRRACSTLWVAMDPNPGLGIGGGSRQGTSLEDLLFRGNTIGTPSTVLCERSLFDEVGGFDPAFSQCADWEMWIRLARVTEFVCVDEPLVRYRWHAENMSRDVALLERDSVGVLQKTFATPGLPESLLTRRRVALGRNYMVLAGSYLRAGRYRSFLRCAVRAIVLDARQAAYLAAFPLRVATRPSR